MRVGMRSMEFTNQVIHHAIYGTGWDGTITIWANTRGRLDVTTSKPWIPGQAAPGS